MNELTLVSKISRLMKYDSSVIRGIGDDAAVIKYTKDKYLLFTADMLIEGIDFRHKDNPGALGHKSLACSLSDIAAMGGVPKYALISLGCPKRNSANFIKGFLSGALKLAGRFKVNIVGGDLSSSKKKVIDVSMIGEVAKRRLILRSNAKEGDMIFVSGELGGSLYGSHLSFMPRVKEANYLASNYKVNSMIDISDGLSIDLYRLTQASNAGAIIYENLIPVSSEARSPDEALYMGEDFELLFTMPQNEASRLIKNTGLFYKMIGEVKDKRYGLKIITKAGREKALKPKGYQHF